MSSLTPFQNSESIKLALFEELQNILSADSAVRKVAEEHVNQLEYTEGYGVYLAEFAMSQSIDLGLRQLASVMLKRYVESHWSENDKDISKVIATDQAKKMIKNILPNGLYDPNSKIRTAVAYTISSIASWDWPENWTELFDIIVKCLGGNDDSVHGAMQVLIEFTYDLNSQITNVGPIILSEVYRIVEAENIYSIRTRASAVRIFKSIIRSINTHVETKQERSKLLNPIVPEFLRYMVLGISAPNGATSCFALKMEIVKVFRYMVTDMPKFIEQYLPQIMPPIWHILTTTADIFVKADVNELDYLQYESGDPDFHEHDYHSLIFKIFEFINAVLETKKFKPIIKDVLTDLTYITILYAQIPQAQVEEWSDDMEKFVEDEDEESPDYSVRVCARDCIANLATEFETQFLAALSEALGKHMSVADAEQMAGNVYWWKIPEACMLSVGAISEIILKNPNDFNLAQFLNWVRNIMGVQVSPFLSGRCLCVMSHFANSEIFSVEMLGQILEAINESLKEDKHMTLRIGAVRCIYEFCDNLKKSDESRRALVASKLGEFSENIMLIIPQSKSVVICLILETVTAIAEFDPNFLTTVSSKFISLAIAVLLKYHDTPFIVDMVQDLIKVLCKNPYCMLPLQERITPTLVSILNMRGPQANVSLQEIALDVMSLVVRATKEPICNALIETAFPAMIECILNTDDNSVMQSGGETLRQFLQVAPEQVCGYKNGEGSKYIMQVATMLLNPMQSESTASFAGRLVITIIGKAGVLLGDNIDMLLKAVISKMQLVESLNVVMSLMLVFAHLILTQMEAVLNFLSTVPGPTGEPAMQFILKNWLARQREFYGVYERTITIMALCKLFEYGITTQDARIVSVTIQEEEEVLSETRTTRSQRRQQPRQWKSVPVLLKVFKLILNELSHYREENAFEQADLSDDEDDEDNEDDSDEGDYFSTSPNKKERANPNGEVFVEEEFEEDDKEALKELMQNINYGSVNMEENLLNFLRTFSRDRNFSTYFEQLTAVEKTSLQSFGVLP